MTTTTFILNQNNAKLLGFVFDGLCRINQEVRHARMEAGQTGYADEVGTSEENLLSAAMMISAEAVARLQPAIDFYRENNLGMHGMHFEYDNLDYCEDAGVANCLSLSAFIWKFLDADHCYWRLAAESLRPQELPMDRIIAEWREQNDLI
jgi:hypothetical protein